MIAYVENSARPVTCARDTGTVWQRHTTDAKASVPASRHILVNLQ